MNNYKTRNLTLG